LILEDNESEIVILTLAVRYVKEVILSVCATIDAKMRSFCASNILILLSTAMAMRYEGKLVTQLIG